MAAPPRRNTYQQCFTGYAYDPFGRRLYKAPVDERGQPITAQATWFVWDGNRLL